MCTTTYCLCCSCILYSSFLSLSVIKSESCPSSSSWSSLVCRFPVFQTVCCICMQTYTFHSWWKFELFYRHACTVNFEIFQWVVNNRKTTAVMYYAWFLVIGKKYVTWFVSTGLAWSLTFKLIFDFWHCYDEMSIWRIHRKKRYFIGFSFESF